MDAKALPCFCLENQYKVSSPTGIIRCIPCRRTCEEQDCYAQKHQCENYEPFPEEEADKCIEPKENEFIDNGIIEVCRQSCGRNQITSGCHCKADRKCFCPIYTHYEDNIGNCWKCSPCTEKNTTKVRQNFCVGKPRNEVSFAKI